MVIGIEKFREYFKAFADSYVIIGGTACDIILEDAGGNIPVSPDCQGGSTIGEE